MLQGRIIAIRAVACLLFVGLVGLLRAEEEGAGHPEKGPHGGTLVELGDEEFHAELSLDRKAKTVTIYILDRTGLKIVPIEGQELLVNLKRGGKPVQYRLKSLPQKGDPEGKSSRFVLKSPELMEALQDRKSTPQLRLKIAGKPFAGKIRVASHEEESSRN